MVLSEDFTEGRVIDGVVFRNPFARRPPAGVRL
jgi:hypothetical protein